MNGIKDEQSPCLIPPCSVMFTPALAKLLFKISLKIQVRASHKPTVSKEYANLSLFHILLSLPLQLLNYRVLIETK